MVVRAIFMVVACIGIRGIVGRRIGLWIRGSAGSTLIVVVAMPIDRAVFVKTALFGRRAALSAAADGAWWALCVVFAFVVIVADTTMADLPNLWAVVDSDTIGDALAIEVGRPMLGWVKTTVVFVGAILMMVAQI